MHEKWLVTDGGSGTEHGVTQAQRDTLSNVDTRYSVRNDVPDQLIGMWYAIPIPEVCAVYGIWGPCQDVDTQPIGYGTTNTDEDNQALNAVQKTWHKHNGLCVWNVGTTQALTAENMPEADCLAVSGLWFSTFGWMSHLYNFIPNQDGRFRMWSTNVPGEGG